MGCEEIRDLLALYAGGESYENERAAVEAHVAVCAACARELDQYREVRANLASLREGSAPPGTFKSIWPAVRMDRFPAKPAPNLAWMDSVLRYAAVVMVGLAIGIIVHVAQRRPASPETLKATTAAAPVTIPAPVQPATMPRMIVPVRRAPASSLELDGTYYLPRVESIPEDRSKDY
ncbi:MAG: zf-HC2 domain-containing protein [Planctomycetaceae bacterium]|nr:zf-HC2 domain-containing protein [Planctomycetaceae bacterium]